MQTFELSDHKAYSWTYDNAEYFLHIKQDQNAKHPLLYQNPRVDIIITEERAMPLFSPWAEPNNAKVQRMVEAFCCGPAWRNSLETKPDLMNRWDEGKLLIWLASLPLRHWMTTISDLTDGAFVATPIYGSLEGNRRWTAFTAEPKEIVGEESYFCGCLVSIAKNKPTGDIKWAHKTLLANLTEFLNRRVYHYALYKRVEDAWVLKSEGHPFHGTNGMTNGLFNDIIEKNPLCCLKNKWESNEVRTGRAKKRRIVTYEFEADGSSES